MILSSVKRHVWYCFCYTRNKWETRKSLEARNASQMILFIKGRSCNQKPLEHQEMTKKNTFYEKEQGEITQVKCKIWLWFLSSALPLINIYVRTELNFNHFCTFQDMAQAWIHYEKKWLRGDNYVNTQGMSTALPLTAIDLQTKFHFDPFCTFQDIAQTGIHYDKYKVKGR